MASGADLTDQEMAGIKNNLQAAMMSPPTELPGFGQSGHSVLFYRENEFLFEVTSQFIKHALDAGDSAIVIAPADHRDGLADSLYRQGLDLGDFIQSESYLELDAAELLRDVLVHGSPDRARFRSLLSGQLAHVGKSSKQARRVVVVDEMASLLWQEGKVRAAHGLEQLWHDLAESHAISVCCAYSLELFRRPEDEEAFEKVCHLHGMVVPGDSYPLHGSSEERLRSIARLQQKALALETEILSHRKEERFHELVDAIQDYSILILDPCGRVATWNSGAKLMLGFDEREVLGCHFSHFFTDEDMLVGKPSHALQVAERDGRFEDQGWRVRKNGRKLYVNAVITAIRDERGALIGFADVKRDLTRRMANQESLDQLRDSILESEKSLRKFSLLVMLRQEEERRRVGSELIDNLGQGLSVLKMKLDSVQSAADGRVGQTDEEIGQCLKIVEDSIEEVRSVSYLLYPPLLEEVGLKAVIPWYLDGFTKRTGIKTTFRLSPDFGRISNEASETLFRVLQEALANIHQHSGSGNADVQLLRKGNTVVLTISDTGKGMPPDFPAADRQGIFPQGVGVGIRGMSERLRYLGGGLEISSSVNGTTVTATIPVASCAAVAMSA